MDNKGYLAELETQDEDTGINDYLDRGSYYWIGLRRDVGKDEKYFLVMEHGPLLHLTTQATILFGIGVKREHNTQSGGNEYGVEI